MLNGCGKSPDAEKRHQNNADDEYRLFGFRVHCQVLGGNVEYPVVEQGNHVFIELFYKKVIEIGFGFRSKFAQMVHQHKTDDPHEYREAHK